MRILVVEDDPLLSDGLHAGLELFGATPDAVFNCADARAALASNKFDALVLDLTLPDGSGLDLLTELRAGGDRTPVLLLTGRNTVGDRIRGLDAGADDYLGKPFDLHELAARVRAIIRRQSGRASSHLACNGVVLDLAQRTVTTNGEPTNLSRREFALLSTLMDRPGIVISRNDLEAQLYGWQEEIESNAVEVHVHRLRTKIGASKIETVRGLGYRMRIDTI